MHHSATPVNDDLWGAVHKSAQPSFTHTKESPMNQNNANAASNHADNAGATEVPKNETVSPQERIVLSVSRNTWKQLVGETLIVSGTMAAVAGVAYLGFRYIPRLFNRGE